MPFSILNNLNPTDLTEDLNITNSYDDLNSSFYYNSTLLFVNSTNGISTGFFGWCNSWKEFQHWLFHMAHVCFFISYALPTTRYGLIIMHILLIFGFSFLSSWAWRVACAPDIFIWNLFFISINLCQLVYVLYQMRPIKFDEEYEEIYSDLFEPFKVTRLQFKKLVGDQDVKLQTLNSGEPYAVQNVTRTDKLALLLSGRAYASIDRQFLHPIRPGEFLDSPEFESRANSDNKFNVSVVAITSCRILVWPRELLEYLFVKETYLASVIAILVAKDITLKLYAMNNRMVTDKGTLLDIRLPSLASALKTKAGRPRVIRVIRRHPSPKDRYYASSPESTSSRDRLIKSRSSEAQTSTPILVHRKTNKYELKPIHREITTISEVEPLITAFKDKSSKGKSSKKTSGSRANTYRRNEEEAEASELIPLTETSIEMADVENSDNAVSGYSDSDMGGFTINVENSDNAVSGFSDTATVGFSLDAENSDNAVSGFSDNAIGRFSDINNVGGTTNTDNASSEGATGKKCKIGDNDDEECDCDNVENWLENSSKYHSCEMTED